MTKISVYVITSGCYSDYGIHGVSLSRKNAQKCIDNALAAEEYWAEDAAIEEWEVDGLLKSKRMEVWRCGMLLDDGSIVESRPDPNVIFEAPFRGRITQYATKVPMYKNRRIVRTESTVSQKHAQKLAVEARQKWLRGRSGRPSSDEADANS